MTLFCNKSIKNQENNFPKATLLSIFLSATKITQMRKNTIDILKVVYILQQLVYNSYTLIHGAVS